MGSRNYWIFKARRSCNESPSGTEGNDIPVTESWTSDGPQVSQGLASSEQRSVIGRRLPNDGDRTAGPV